MADFPRCGGAAYALSPAITLLQLPIYATRWQYYCSMAAGRTVISMAPRALDRLDRRILEELQLDARISNQELAKRVGLSPAPCWRRLRRLERAGFIAGYATLLKAPAIGLPILAYAVVSLENHHPESVRQFDQLVKERPEVLECHSMSGANDYLLRIVAASMEAYG